MKTINPFLLLLLIIFISGRPCDFTWAASADNALLKQIIIVHNQDHHERSMKDGSYRGEEGVLRIRPEMGKSLGLNVFINQDYIDSKNLFERAERALDRAKRAMATLEKERFPGEITQRIAEQFLLFKETEASALHKLKLYQSKLSDRVDDRFNHTIIQRILDDLLEKCLKKTGQKLREALGCFYNQCQGTEQKEHHLTPENIHFVNDVFHQFGLRAKAGDKKRFYMDRSFEFKDKTTVANWKMVVEKQCSPYISLIESALKKHGEKRDGTDPLLLVALMKRESAFDPFAISSVGAAGLMQIMPRTAKNLGMQNIYSPTYFKEAMGLLAKERNYRNEALAVLFQINDQNKMDLAAKARRLMQRSLSLSKKKERLFARYRLELLRKKTDDRLQPKKAIEYGFKYFSALLRDQKGDISLALASYNAGPHRIKQYNGIPPFEETVKFRNMVLQYYRDYLQRATGKDL